MGFLLQSCPFLDKRVVGINESETSVLMAVCLSSPTERDDILSYFSTLPPGEKKAVCSSHNYNNLSDDSIMVIVIAPELENSLMWENGYVEYECILEEKTYEYTKIAIADIERKWGKTYVKYPSAGFRPAK